MGTGSIRAEHPQAPQHPPDQQLPQNPTWASKPSPSPSPGAAEELQQLAPRPKQHPGLGTSLGYPQGWTWVLLWHGGQVRPVHDLLRLWGSLSLFPSFSFSSPATTGTYKLRIPPASLFRKHFFSSHSFFDCPFIRSGFISRTPTRPGFAGVPLRALTRRLPQGMEDTKILPYTSLWGTGVKYTLAENGQTQRAAAPAPSIPAPRNWAGGIGAARSPTQTPSHERTDSLHSSQH